MALIRDILKSGYDKKILSSLIHCFRELTLTALVLQHVYPEKYCMCSHHIASLLYITGHQEAGTVPEYFVGQARIGWACRQASAECRPRDN